MNSKALIGILFEAHQHFTINSPIYQHPVKNLDNIDMEKVYELLHDINKIDTFAKKCYEDLEKMNLSYGTVHYRHKFWVDVALVALNSKKNTIPNGCCSATDCTVNIFYDIICENLQKDL